jgi:FixJ family two-component response regulator
MAIVYLVEDNEPVRRALSRLLHAAGFETREFESGDEFMKASIDLRRACVVAESLMPSGTVIDLPRQLRASGRDIPVILLAEDINGQSRALARSAGASFIFRKPVDGQALIDVVEWVLGDPGVRPRNTKYPRP